MRILVMNDDGINAPGIYALALAMSQIGEVTVVAPAEQQSAASHRINIADTLRVRKAHFGTGLSSPIGIDFISPQPFFQIRYICFVKSSDNQPVSFKDRFICFVIF